MKTLLAAVLLAAAVPFASAAAPAKAPPQDRAALIAMHEKMIAAHQKMVDCLKSDKSVQACRDEMRKDCPMAKSGQCPYMDGNCPMMGGTGRRPARRGMGRGRGMGPGRGRGMGMGMGPGAQAAPQTPPPADDKK
jgi:hypothetical protein